MQKQIITLEVLYDPVTEDEPSQWDWPGLIGNEVKVIKTEEPEMPN